MKYWKPEMNHTTPCMDMYALQKRLMRRTDINNANRSQTPSCKSCPYYSASDCWQRLMLDASHAIALLLAERDKGEALIVGDADEE